MKETNELLVFLTQIILKTIHNQKDGFQLGDLLTYIENIKDAPQAFTGLKAIKGEFEAASTEEVKGLVSSVKAVIVEKEPNIDTLLLEALVSSLTTLFSTYALLAKK